MNEKTNESKTPEDEPEPALVIDGRGVFDRGWHKSRNSEELAHLDSARAAACAALMVLLPVLGSSMLDTAYRRALFAWDSGFHKTTKPRKPKPEGFVEDFEYFKQIVATLAGGAYHSAPHHEADDVVATVAARGHRVCIVSGDKDLQQLVNRQVAYYCLNKKSLLSAQHIMERWDLRHPSHLAVRLAVVGDPQDGIGGVEKWGEKKWTPKIMATAPAQCDLGGLVEHVAGVIPADQVDNFYRSLEATLLQTDVPNVPEPAPLLSVALEYLEDEGLTEISRNYARYIGDLRGSEPSESAVDREY